ncbi:MAG: hypothetical protein GWM90_27360, partial [Gemmatimonadetes bacterium]|nr:hypothetical protein [Gemmatimonadota bacterium]NIQ58692.1 hypothetical protein [Gemmatimonadota bacterium]NIU78882.1 hypothetical protein [Gammaproteobacteria bacterium]NIX47650.1 hypothetical protein [Gemmatimonadota bacterium]NIY12020.1 hypothetical protein [Gemmatimonadota bacterium]
MSEPTSDPIRQHRSAALLLACLAAGPAGAAGQDALGVAASAPAAAAVFDSVTETPPLSRGYWGIAVYDARSGRPLLRRNADRLFVPASNMKLVTAAAAMELLGPDYRFLTRIEADVDGEGIADSLVVFGAGDPTLGAPFHEPPLAALDSVADSLAAAGLR